MGFVSRLLRLGTTIKGGWDWYLLLAGAGILPPSAVVIAALLELPAHLVGLYALAGVAYFLVVYVETRPLWIRVRLSQLLRDAERVRAIADIPSRAGEINRWRRLRFVPPDVREFILFESNLPGSDWISICVERIRTLLASLR